MFEALAASKGSPYALWSIAGMTSRWGSRTSRVTRKNNLPPRWTGSPLNNDEITPEPEPEPETTPTFDEGNYDDGQYDGN